jgi:hypothetical protein
MNMNTLNNHHFRLSFIFCNREKKALEKMESVKEQAIFDKEICSDS